MFTVVGLGNPGPQYELTRHNVGQMVLDEVLRRIGTSMSQHKPSNTRAASARLMSPSGEAEQVILAVSNSYMNTSGGPVSALLRYFHGEPEKLLVIHDELDLPFGTLKLKRGGGEGGHNGLKSITKSLGTKDYVRLRFGVGRPPGRQDPADFVLSRFSAAENKELPVLLAMGADAVFDVLEQGLEKAQLRLHTNGSR